MKRTTKRFRCEDCDTEISITKEWDSDESMICAYCGKFIEEVV